MVYEAPPDFFRLNSTGKTFQHNSLAACLLSSKGRRTTRPNSFNGKQLLTRVSEKLKKHSIHSRRGWADSKQADAKKCFDELREISTICRLDLGYKKKFLPGFSTTLEASE